ncbi:MAG TPA: hypothetical protein VLT59_09155 [Steroidobacteraceae bacterium]|nr:hypothetical protein [Steroidobacteraceae bacterium]
MVDKPQGENRASRPESQRLDEAREQVKDTGRRVRQAAEERAEHEFERRGEEASRRIDETATALEESAERFRAHDQTSLARIAEEGAQMLSRLSGSLRDKSLEDLSGQLQYEARRHPGFFVAGAVGVGFAMSRFLRASSSHRRSHYGHSEHSDRLPAERDPAVTHGPSATDKPPGTLGQSTGPRPTAAPGGRPTGYGQTTTPRPPQGPGVGRTPPTSGR